MILTGTLKLYSPEPEKGYIDDGFLRYYSDHPSNEKPIVSMSVKKGTFGPIDPIELTYQIAEPAKSLRPDVP